MAHYAVDSGAVAQAKFLGDILIQQVAYATSTIGSVKGLPDCSRVLSTVATIVSILESTSSTTIDSRRELAKDLVFKNIILQLLQLCNKLSAAQDVKRVFHDPSTHEVPLCTAVGSFLHAVYNSLEALDGTCDCCNPGTVIFKKLHRQLPPALLPFVRQLATTVDATTTEVLASPNTTAFGTAISILSGALSALTFCFQLGSSPQDPHAYASLHTQLAKEHALDRICRLFITLSPCFQTGSLFSTPSISANIRVTMQNCLVQTLSMLFPASPSTPFYNAFGHPFLLSPPTIEAIKPLMLKHPHTLLQLVHHIASHLCDSPPSIPALFVYGLLPAPVTPPSHPLVHNLILRAGMWLGSYPHLSRSPLYQQAAESLWPMLAGLLWCCQAPRTTAELQRAQALVALLGVLPLPELAAAAGDEEQRSMRRIAEGVLALLNHLTQYILQVNERLQGPQPLGRSWLKAGGWEQLRGRADLAVSAADVCLRVLAQLALGEEVAAGGGHWVEELLASRGFPGQVQRLLGALCPHASLLHDASSPGSMAVLAMTGLSQGGPANIVPDCCMDDGYATQASMLLPDNAYIAYARMALSVFSAAVEASSATAASLARSPCPLHTAAKRRKGGDDCEEGCDAPPASGGGEDGCTCTPPRPGGIYPMAPALLIGARAMACMRAEGVGPQEQPPSAVRQAATCASQGLMHVLLLPFWAHTEGSIAKVAEVVLRKCMPPDVMLASLAQTLRSSLLAWGAPTPTSAEPACSSATGV